MRKGIWDFIDNTQTTLLGMAVCSGIVYYKLDAFKHRLGDWFDMVGKCVTVSLIALFIFSGWQAVKFIIKNASRFKKEDND